MNNPATIEHIRGAIERPLTSDEERVIQADWIPRAWRTLLREVPGIEARNALPVENELHLKADDVRDVVVAMVERKLRNPGGTRQWGTDDYTETVDQEMSAGRIYVTDAERASLAPRAAHGGDQIFSIPLSSRP